MRRPWKATTVDPECEPEHEAVSERLDEVEKNMKSMAHRVLLLEVELGLYDPDGDSENQTVEN